MTTERLRPDDAGERVAVKDIGRASADHPGGEEPLDPFTLEIIGDRLTAIGEEMFVTTQRTSQSVLVYEVLDFAVGLTDRKGDLITQGNGVTVFLATLDAAVKSVLDAYGAQGIYEGDIFMTNDPYAGGGTHLNDVTLVMPIFYAGELVAFAVNKAHWIEVGGANPGSVSASTTSVFQEGLQFPCIKVYDRGVANDAVLAIVRANVRLPDMVLGDLHAQTASLRVAARRFAETCEKYGVSVVERAFERMATYSEERVRIELGKLPEGTYHAEDLIDRDANGDGPYRVCVTVTVGSASLVCDFTGTDDQALSSINCSRTGLISAARIIFKAITTPGSAVNAGSFRSLEVICPDRTIFSCERPAPVSSYWESLLYVTDLVWKALAPVVPERLTAGHYLSPCADLIAGEHPDTGELFILFEPNAGGWGAGLGKDGERGLICVGDGETYMIPVEVMEQRYGLVVEQYAFSTERAAGAGRWRGGEGIVRDYRLTAEEATVTATFGRHESSPWGVAGGHDGSRNRIELIPAGGGEPHVAGMISGYSLRKGDVVRIWTGTGGGWGDPLEREPALVAADVRNEFISRDEARDVYGVEVSPNTYEVVGPTPARIAKHNGQDGG